MCYYSIFHLNIHVYKLHLAQVHLTVVITYRFDTEYIVLFIVCLI